MSPPCSRAIERATARPSPTPPVSGLREPSISDREVHLRAVARMHPPRLTIDLYRDRDGRPLNPRYGLHINPCIYDVTEIMLSQGSVALPNCVTLEPKAVHARRNYKRITDEVARMIEEGGAQPEEIYFVFLRNWEDSLVRFGGRQIPHKIGKDKSKMSYEDRTVTFGDNSIIRKIRSVGVFDYYLRLYSRLRDGRLERSFPNA